MYQKCWIPCSRILLNVLHSTSLTVLLLWQHSEFQTSPIILTRMLFWPPLVFHFDLCSWCRMRMMQQAYKYVSSSSWPCFMCFELDITNILKSSGWKLEKNELPWEENYFNRRTVSEPRFNGLCCKLAKIAGKQLFSSLIEYCGIHLIKSRDKKFDHSTTLRQNLIGNCANSILVDKHLVENFRYFIVIFTFY